MSEISCSKCGLTFSKKGNLNRHIRSFHHDVKLKTCYNQICSICSEKFLNMKQLQIHIGKQHVDIKLSYEKKTFYCNSDFQEWKRKHESESNCSFISRNGAKRFSDGTTINYFHCHRSGMAKLKIDDRKRSEKCAGSVKINTSCPAMMKVSSLTINEATEIEVEFQSVHLGHDLDIRKLSLTKSERSRLASMLQCGISTTKLLKTIRRKNSPTKHHITRKHLNNICRDFKIDQKVVYLMDDAMSVDSEVQKMKEHSDSVLVYKPVGKVIPSYPEIEENEFILGIMNTDQLKLLECYGSNVVIVDSTSFFSVDRTNKYGFHLTTLMVIDENDEGFPVAIMYSTKIAMGTFLPFFNEVKNRLPGLRTKALLSDDIPAFYAAWERVFGDESKHLLCSRNTIHNWNKNLKAKVKNFDLQLLVIKELKAILYETDQIAFENVCSSFIVKYKKMNETKDFMKYFVESYMSRTEKWAHCHRLGFDVSTTLKLKSFHRQIKYEKAGGQIIKQLDKSLTVVLNAITKKLTSTSMERGNISKITEIQRHHSKVDSMKNYYSFFETENNKTWVVIKAEKSSLETFTVNYEIDCYCNIRCEKCSICIHTLSCTCIDYCTRFVMCNHIHYICQKTNFGRPEIFSSNESSSDNANEENLMIDNSLIYENIYKEKVAFVKETKMCSPTDIDKKKSHLLEKLQKIQQIIQNSNTLKELEFIDKNLSTVEMYHSSHVESVHLSLPDTLQ